MLKRLSARHVRIQIDLVRPTRGSTGRMEEVALAYAEAYLGRAELDRLLSRDNGRPSIGAPDLQVSGRRRRWLHRLRGD